MYQLFFWFLLPLGICSLPYFEGGIWKRIPLKSLQVTGEFYDSLGEVVIKQLWENEANVPITSNYKFSLDANAVVSGYKMRIGEKSWSGVVKAKDTARSEFNTAVQAGVKSSLLEKLSDTDYQVEIGPISPFESVEVEFRYLTRAPVQKDGSYRFVLPTNIAPKYSNPSTANKADREYASKMEEIKYMSQPPYLFNVDIAWYSGSALREIVSPTNVIQTEVLSSVSARVHCTTAPENGDFTLSVRTAQTTAAYTYQKEDGTTFMYVHNQIPLERTSPSNGRKITILLDRSGSMWGGKIVQAVAAIDNYLSLLEPDASTLINIVSFGSNYKALYSNAVPATRENIEKMRGIVRHFQADFGGTELLEVLKSLIAGGSLTRYETNTQNVEGFRPREHVIVLLTDGQVSNLNAVTALLDTKNLDTRVMTIGIGRDADRKLVQQIADKTNAICRILVDEVDITAALADVHYYIGKQYYTDVKVINYEATQCAQVLYPAHPVDMFIRLSAEQYREVTRSGITVTAADPTHHSTKMWSISVDQCVKAGPLLEKLYANLIINEEIKQLDIYEPRNRAEVKSHIVRLSVEHGIMNTETSFLVVSDEKITPREMQRVEKVEVPLHQEGMAMGGNAQFARASQNTPPSFVPSVTPSSAPSVIPSAMPSVMPSVAPSVAPSACPSCAPSVVPSVAPSRAPSSSPSVMPSVAPSVMPSSEPSMQPSSQLSSQPSGRPSMQPTSQPSSQPSRLPSEAPSVVPSASPTVVPSMSPSVSPSVAPSAAPSVVPSVAPSVIPSEAPSVCPSVAHSSSPSIVPSVVPSVFPSVAPSIAPSVPSIVPSIISSMSPSIIPFADTARSAPPTAVHQKRGEKLTIGPDGTVHPQPHRGGLITAETLQSLQHADGSLFYNTQSFVLLQYDSLFDLEEDARAAGLTPSLYFNVAVLVLLESEHGQQHVLVQRLAHSQVQLLSQFVNSQVSRSVLSMVMGLLGL